MDKNDIAAARFRMPAKESRSSAAIALRALAESYQLAAGNDP